MTKTMTITPLDRIAATIVAQLEQVNVYHYNKLAYLFEYLFIKNFGTRYSREVFIKLPHGPVIKNYKKQITNLSRRGIVSVNEELLNKKRTLADGKQFDSVLILRTEITPSYIIEEPLASALAQQVIRKYGRLSIEELETVVYQTSPVKTYMKKAEEGFKKATGGDVLKDCIRIKDYKNSRTEGRKLAMEHLKKYPFVNPELQAQFSEELKPLEKLRPKYE
jgi:uncharacterized phage-associated protein